MSHCNRPTTLYDRFNTTGPATHKSESGACLLDSPLSDNTLFILIICMRSAGPESGLFQHRQQFMHKESMRHDNTVCPVFTKLPDKNPRPFLRPAIENHLDEFKDVLESELSNAQ